MKKAYVKGCEREDESTRNLFFECQISSINWKACYIGDVSVR